MGCLQRSMWRCRMWLWRGRQWGVALCHLVGWSLQHNIPKTDMPKSVKEMRPIALPNVT